jgi:glycosyltransferase involved in cell wall biosynthesis
MIKTANLVASVSRKAGGLFESVRGLVRSLAENGLDVRVFAGQDEFTASDIGAWSGLQVSTLPGGWPRVLAPMRGVGKALEDFDPDVTHTHGLWQFASIATRRYSRKKKWPYVVSPHGMLDGWALGRSRWKKALAAVAYERPHLEGARCLRALCESEAEAMRRFGLKNDIAVIPNGVELPVLNGSETVDHDLSWRNGAGQKVLLYLGRIHTKKGLVNLLEGWKAATERRAREWVLMIAGWDQDGHEAELKELARELGLDRGEPACLDGGSAMGLGSSVIFAGPQFGRARAACYGNCDAVILPSFSEGVPMVVLEAWANAKPVLMTPACNLPEGFAAGAALRIEPSVESITQGLAELFRMPGPVLGDMGQRGRELVARRFGWPAIATEMKCVYEWILGGGAKPGCVVGR